VKSGKTLALFLVCATFSFAQNITSITCFRSWIPNDKGNTSCKRTLSAASGDFSCNCAAKCGVPKNNISANYHIWWALTGGTDVGTGTITGGAQPSAVKVAGSLILACDGVTKGGSGFDQQDCQGVRKTTSFTLSCP
jgi:hypothetical protein